MSGCSAVAFAGNRLAASVAGPSWMRAMTTSNASAVIGAGAASSSAAPAWLLHGLYETAAPRTTRDMHGDHEMFGLLECAGRVLGQQILRRMVCYGHFSSSNSSLRRFIASLIRDFTVPSGIPSVFAISG